MLRGRAALAFVGAVALAGCPVRPKPESRGPFLSILRREGSAAAGALPDGSIALALGGLPSAELPRLRARLAESVDSAVRRAAPTLYDLEGTADDAGPPPADPLRGALPNVPALTAAANVLGAPWVGPGVSVELGPACNPAASRCVPLFGPAADPPDAVVRRGRALAWALANGARLRVPASSRPALLLALRQAAVRPSSTIALVFDASRGTLDATELDLARQQARQAVAFLPAHATGRPWIEALGAARADWALPIALDADELLVIPRLGALARLQDFRAEIEGAGTFDWVAGPRGARGS
jgi:hypothetical protein